VRRRASPSPIRPALRIASELGSATPAGTLAQDEIEHDVVIVVGDQLKAGDQIGRDETDKFGASQGRVGCFGDAKSIGQGQEGRSCAASEPAEVERQRVDGGMLAGSEKLRGPTMRGLKLANVSPGAKMPLNP
jgi:hypothetical protein